MSVIYIVSSHRDLTNLKVFMTVTSSFEWLEVLNKKPHDEDVLIAASSVSTQVIKVLKSELELKRIELIVLDEDALLLNLADFEKCKAQFIQAKFDNISGKGNKNESASEIEEYPLDHDSEHTSVDDNLEVDDEA